MGETQMEGRAISQPVGSGSGAIDGLVGRLRVSARERRRGREGTSSGRNAEQGLALLAETGRGEHGTAACFIIEQDSADDRLQIAADAGAIVIKDFGNAVNVGRSRMARDETLDELAADERADVRIVGDVIEGQLEVIGAIDIV